MNRTPNTLLQTVTFSCSASVVFALLLTPAFAQQSSAKHSSATAGTPPALRSQNLPRSGVNVKTPPSGTKISGTRQELDHLEHQTMAKHVSTATPKSATAGGSSAKTSRPAHGTAPINFSYQGPKGKTNSNTKKTTATPSRDRGRS